MINEINILKLIFCFLGKHSTNIWLIHGYWINGTIIPLKYLYLSKYTFLIWLWILELTILSSFLVNIILIPLNNIIFKKNLNYKGFFLIIIKIRQNKKVINII